MTATFEPHPLDLRALVSGVAFLVVGLATLAQQLDWLDLSGRTWAGIVVLAIGAAGAAGVTAAAVRAGLRRERHAASGDPTSGPAASPPPAP
jgi:hypothetical protein